MTNPDDTDAHKVRRVWRLAAQESALPHLHTAPPNPVHDEETCTANEPHEVIYIQLSDTGENIRKWSRSPFEGGRMCRVALPASGMSASGQDPQGLEAKPASPTGEDGDAQGQSA